MKAPEPAVDSVEEVDVWWGGYSWRTLAPAFVLCGVLTVIVAFSVRILAARYGLSANFSRLVTDAFGLLFWLTLVLAWAYRTVAINYRLTTHRLYCQRGLYTPSNPGVELGQIAQVVVIRNALERMMGVGRVRATLIDSPVVIEMDGLRDPNHIAVMIRREVERVRGAGRKD